LGFSTNDLAAGQKRGDRAPIRGGGRVTWNRGPVSLRGKLSMICVLNVIQGPAIGKRIWLKENQCIEVGRASLSDFPIASDAHLSRRHLLLDSTGGAFRVRDMGSSNGTFLNDQRVSVSELKTGDTLRAGLSTFRISFLENDANPHEEDGIHFSQSTQEQPRTATELATGRRTIDFGHTSDLDATVKIMSDRGLGPTSTDFSGVLVPGIVERIDASALALEDFLQQHVTSKGPSHLYGLAQPLHGPQGEYLGLLDRLAQGHVLTVVVNETQLEPHVALAVKRFGAPTGFARLSQTLMAGQFELGPELRSLLLSCMKQDALICLGGPEGIPPEHLKPHCNSLSYPSLFGSHLGDLQSSMRRFLLDKRAFAIFEWNQTGEIGLFR